MSKAAKNSSTSRRAVLVGGAAAVVGGPSLARADGTANSADQSIVQLANRILVMECQNILLLRAEQEPASGFVERLWVLREQLIAMKPATIKGLVAKARVAACFTGPDDDDRGWGYAAAIDILRLSRDPRDRAVVVRLDQGGVHPEEAFLDLLAAHLPEMWSGERATA